MKSLEVFLEKRARDYGLDIATTSKLSRDLSNALQLRYQMAMSEQQGLNVPSRFFALASPIMPFPFLGLFMFLDKMGAAYEKHQYLSFDVDSSKRSQLSQAVYMAARGERDLLEKKRKGLETAIPVELLAARRNQQNRRAELFGAKAAETGKTEKSSTQGLRARERKALLLSKPGRDEIGHLIKQKSVLLMNNERARSSQDYSSACRLSARIELLDKALKRLGC